MQTGTTRQAAQGNASTADHFSTIAPNNHDAVVPDGRSADVTDSSPEEETASCAKATQIRLARTWAESKLYSPRDPILPDQLLMGRSGICYIADVGYTHIVVSPEEIGKDGKLTPLQRCTLVTFPCCIFGPLTAIETFRYERAYLTFTIAVSIVDILFFVVMVAVHGFDSTSNNMMIGPSPCALYKAGGKWTPDIVVHGQVWRLLSPLFIHAGVVHLALNLFAQLSLGLQCEFAWSSPAFIAIYLFSGVVGNVASALGSPHTLSIGASGAILGVLGALITHTWITWTKTDVRIRAARARGLAVTLVLLVGSGFIASVDNWAHFGGLAAGMVSGCVVFRSELVFSGWKRFVIQSAALVGVAVMAVFTVVLFTQQREDFAVEC